MQNVKILKNIDAKLYFSKYTTRSLIVCNIDIELLRQNQFSDIKIAL